ncbi:MAG: amidohydrolase family protein, partial [Bacteroidales bacterium]|nr:amidohydrolase family protein [Bacteroidales bacterium]
MLKQITNSRILTEEGWLVGGSIVIENGKIIEVLNSELPLEGAEIIDAKGCDVVPGGIELHIHGGGGRDFMEGTEEAFRTAVAAHMHYGTTAIYPTLSSSTREWIDAAIETCEKLMAEPGSPIMGLHLEGPYFNLSKAGAQMPDIIRNPDPKEYEDILSKTQCIKRWDAAPELPGAKEFFESCIKHGVTPAIAHTDGEWEDVKMAYDAGVRLATHFTNAMSALKKDREFKKAGVVESVYALDDFNVEVISDGIHVPPVVIKQIYNAKGNGHMCFITDS